MNYNSADDKFVATFKAGFHFSDDYAKLAGRQERMLIVEGWTDADFLKQIKLEPTVRCSPVNEFRKSHREMLKGKNIDLRQGNCKKTIVNLVLVEANKMKALKLYGMVDLDYEKASQYDGKNNLFATDTSDLETLLLSTDPELLNKIKTKFELGEGVLRNVFFKAYYFAKVKAALMNNIGKDELSVNEALQSSADIDFPDFLSENCINIPALLSYIAEKNKKELTQDEIKEFCSRAIASDAILKERTDTDTFSCNWETEDCDPRDLQGFWNVVNGHVVLKLLILENARIAEAYASSGDDLNRKFEEDLINNYNCKMFYPTRLSRKMSKAGLLRARS